MSQDLSPAASSGSPGESPAEPGSVVRPSDARPIHPASYTFLGVLASLALAADAVTKWWAETTLSQLTRMEPSIVLIDDVLTFTLAYNQGGAFGMLAGEDGVWRRPFFLLVSGAASVFIISLYRKIHPEQWALRWGLPLVLGGALGNFADRLAKGKVVDFVDYRASWVEQMNELITKVNPSWHVTSHWPTFNVADICICVGVGLMVVDMFTAGGQQARAHSESNKSAAHKPA